MSEKMQLVGAAIAIAGLALTGIAGCAETPAHVATGRLDAAGREIGAWSADHARCDRGHQGDRIDARARDPNVPVRLTFEHGRRDRDTVIEIPYEPTPQHVNVSFPGTFVRISARQCEQFEAHVSAENVEGQEGDYARGSLRLRCPIPTREGTIDVMVDFDQC